MNGGRMLIVVNGAVASGKSTVSRAVAGISERAGHRSAVIDLDEIWHMLDHQQPRTGGMEKWLLARKATAALTDLFFDSGVSVVIAEGPFFTGGERDGYTSYLRASPAARFVTLAVSYAESLQRATGDPHPERVMSKDPTWLRARHDESSALIEQLRGTDLIVETDGRSVADVAQEIASAVGLPPEPEQRSRSRK